MRQKIEQLTTSLMEDCLQAQTPQEMFNALSRLEKGAQAISALVDAKWALNASEASEDTEAIE
jgi:hypothetical protein